MEQWIKEALSEEQQKPFESISQNNCILAAAGSGKTRTLVHLIANELKLGTDPSKIIAFTFTEKAAKELFFRIHTISKKYMPEIDISGIYIGTIHSWCLNYLLEHNEFYNFSPIDELHVDALVSRTYDSLGLKESYNKNYPKAIPDFLADLELYYNENLSIDEIPSKIRPCIDSFLKILEQNRLITFGGMIKFSKEHLKKNSGVLDSGALFVDEYQDVNPAQVDLIKSIMCNNTKLFVVGDDLQSVYNWRGSDVKRIIEFEKDFQSSSLFRLSENYRSRPRIVNASNKIAERVSFRDTKKQMNPKRPKIAYESLYHLSSGTDQDQINEIVNVIRRFSENNVPWNNMAILLRSVLSWGRQIVEALEFEGIPVYCPILSRGGEFINSFVLPCLEWLMSGQDEPKSEEEEKEAEEKADVLWQSAMKWGAKNEDIFWDELNTWWDIVEASKNSAYDVRGRFYDFLSACGIKPDADDRNLLVGLGIASQIIRSVEEIHRRRINGFSRRTAKGVVKEIYFALIRNQNSFGESVPIDTTQNAVLISTVHQAKGIEWPIVLLPMLNQKRFPVQSRRHQTSFPDEIANRYGTSSDDERRLFYVAFTRAKERLFLFDSKKYEPKNRSIFVQHLIEDNEIKTSLFDDVQTKTWIVEEEKDPNELNPISIGLSDLLIYLECPYQFALRRILSIQPSVGDELGFGKGLHELIQRRIDESIPWSDETIEQKVNDHIHLPYTSEEQEQISRNAIKSKMAFLEKVGAFDVKAMSEVSVEVFFQSGAVNGIIDGVLENQDGTLAICDWKSSIHDEFLPRYEKQLQFYAHALSSQQQQVSTAQIVDIKESEIQKEIVSKKVCIDGKIIDDLVDNLESSLESIANGNFPAISENEVCSCCDMSRICSIGDFK